MGVQAKRAGRTLIVTLEGELDLHTVEPFKEAVAEAFAADTRLRNLILIMHRVSFIDSSGVGAILGRYRDVAAGGGSLAVVGLQLPVRRIFDMSGMSRVIAVYESEGEALAHMAR